MNAFSRKINSMLCSFDENFNLYALLTFQPDKFGTIELNNLLSEPNYKLNYFFLERFVLNSSCFILTVFALNVRIK